MDRDENITESTTINPEDLLKSIEELNNQINLLKEQNLRLLADYQNQKKQYDKQYEDMKFFGIKKIMSELIALLDDNKLAQEHIEKSGDLSEYKNAFLQTSKKLELFLMSENIQEINCKEGDEFNPEIMEALGTIEDEQFVNKVKVIAQKGYMLTTVNKVIRPVRVMVGRSKI